MVDRHPTSDSASLAPYGPSEPTEAAQIAQFLDTESPRYQKVALGAGFETKGADRSYLNEFVFADDVAGQSLLDVGASMGYFCFEALRRGAASATGLETSPESVRHARRIAEIRGLPVEFIGEDFEEWDPPQAYDVVLCLNVLHHLYEPIASLRKLMRITRRRVLLEVATAEWAHLRHLGNWPIMLGGLSAPVILLDDAKRNYDVAVRTFAFNRKALSIIFNEHTSAFEPLHFHRSPFRNRLIVEARRRQIDHLVVVAGVTAAGKSTFAARLAASAEMRARFGLGTVEPLVATARHVNALPAGPIDTLIYHYDILRPFSRSIQSHRRDPAFHLLESAQKVTLITLANEPAVLQRRVLDSKLTRGHVKSRNRVIHGYYQNPHFLQSWYRAWLDATEVYHASGSRFFVRSDDDYGVLPDESALFALLRQG